MHEYYWGAGWGVWMVLHWLFWLVLLALLIGAGIVLARQSKGTNSGKTQSALDLLNERYARGEIDREEYLQRCQDIEQRSR